MTPDLAAKISATRAAHPDWTIKQIAREVGSSFGCVQRYFAGQVKPRDVVKIRRLPPYAGRVH